MKKRRIYITAAAAAAVLGAATLSYSSEYSDVNTSNWAWESVNAMSEKGIIQGYPDGSFKPQGTVTYGEFIKMALIGGTGEDPGNAPGDGHWAKPYYDKALELGLFTARDIHESQLDNLIPRGDMALIISSVLGDVKIDEYDTIQNGIEDVNERTPHEYDIVKSYSAGILTGYEDGAFRPEGTLTRAESAAVIRRLADADRRPGPGENADSPSENGTLHKTSELLDMSKLTKDRTVASSVKFTEEYELYTDAWVWDMKMYRAWDGEDCSFDHTLRGYIYLVKDGEIVEYCNTTPKYDEEGNYLYFQRSIAHYDITQADYILCAPSDAKSDEDLIIKAVVNPFKK